MFLDNILDFLNQNIEGLTTLIVGGFAICLYMKRRSDDKKDAASLILQEIRYAEQQIRIARSQGYIYPLSIKLLPTNSWHKNINLFIKDLKETEIDLISGFYSSAQYLDKLISVISSQRSDLMIPVGTMQLSQIEPKKELQEQTIKPPNIQQFESNANRILKDVSEQIEFIYNSPVVERLRQISDKKWYYIWR